MRPAFILRTPTWISTAGFASMFSAQAGGRWYPPFEPQTR